MTPSTKVFQKALTGSYHWYNMQHGWWYHHSSNYNLSVKKGSNWIQAKRLQSLTCWFLLTSWCTTTTWSGKLSRYSHINNYSTTKGSFERRYTLSQGRWAWKSSWKAENYFNKIYQSYNTLIQQFAAWYKQTPVNMD